LRAARNLAKTKNSASDIHLAKHVLSFIEGTPKAPSSDEIFLANTLRLSAFPRDFRGFGCGSAAL
jgi:hypothetical protein